MAEYKIDIEKSAQNILNKIQERFGVSAERLVELASAEREGRVMVLPAQAGDPLTLEQLREAWKPCDGCMSCSNCDDAMQKDDDYPCCECIDSKAPNGLLQASMKYFQATGYCRHCGRPLTPEAWAELGKRLSSR